jgi:hypothetical protein
MRLYASVAVVVGVMTLCSLPYRAGAAGKYDGSAPLLCAAVTVTECEADGRCQRRSAENVNLPSLFRVDAKGMKVRNLEAEKGRESPIQAVAHANGKLVVNGADGERGWIVVINEDTGKLSGVVSGDGEGFVVFGQCALP